MYLHIAFADGSNPFVQFRKRNGERLETRRDVQNALRSWEKRYDISGEWTPDGFMAFAAEKGVKK